MRRNSSVKAICFTALLTCVLVLGKLNSFAQDTEAPTTIITAPANNATIAVGTMVTIKGTASDNNVVASVEVSLDGGTTWQQASGTTNWTYAWTASEAGTISIKSRGIDGAGNMEPVGEAPGSNDIIVNVTASQTGCPCSIFQSTDAPATPRNNDGQPIEVGVRFRSDVDGYITGIRFFKGIGTSGTHTGHLWSNSGTLLASATFKNETASDWQQVLFSAPVAITANTTYVASFLSSSGDYPSTAQFFTQAAINTPLKALSDGTDGPNGVFIYTANAKFPTQSFGSGNYYVDVVFNTTLGPDIVPPDITQVIPTRGKIDVSVTPGITADFNESIDQATINSSTFTLQDELNNLIDANVTYNSDLNEATLIPTSPLSYSTTYTITLKGGSSGIKDVAGNALETNYVSSFATIDPPRLAPSEGPGGPILVISSASNPFSRYTNEILRAEGLNEFAARDVSKITSTVLDSFDVVILGEVPVSSSLVNLITNWTNAGGTLITFRPDAQFAPLLGLSPVGTTLSDKYLLVRTGSGPGVGIVDQTIQYHGTADLYTLDGATSLATLYSDANTSTIYPAVTMNNVGSNGGVAVAFTYPLARSIVYTRQGNPDWAGQKRDGQIPPTRSDDLFFGNASFDPKPDWIDLNKVAIPQADEQQHLLANIINNYDLHNKPLPRFWFLPSGFKAAIVMTGDDHGSGGMVGRFNQYLSLSASNTTQSVLDWKAIRGTSYMYPNTPITDAQVKSFQNQGFEIALHLNTGCENWTPASLDNNFNSQLSQLDAQFPSIAPSKTNRTHCIAWSDWSSQPKIELSKGIRLDVNYYFWPGPWIQNRSGMFTGSGMPLRFADIDGSIIDCYQVPTQMPDESDESFPQFCDQLLNKATGPESYYGVFCANMHTDNATSDGSDAIIASAQAHNVPVVSAKQMLTWLDGRNNSSFKSISWNGTQLSFSIDTGIGARNLQAMVPVSSSVGELLGITRNGTTVNYSTQTIKGIMYAFLAGSKGNYVATYKIDNPAPKITNIVATPHADGTATITWNTDQLSDSRVDYNAEPNPLTRSVADANLVLNHTTTLTGLTANTTYYYRVTSVNNTSKSSTSPTPPDSLSFTMPAPSCTLNATASMLNPILCNGETASVAVSATGGTSPYTGTGTFTASAGKHDYVVTDKNGCSSTATITISEPAPVVVNASPGIIACKGGSTSVVVSATGGTAPYTGTGTVTNVQAGTYTYTVTDANGCSGSTTITIQAPSTVLTVSASVVAPITCNGGSTSVTVSASGGVPPYTGTGTFTGQKAGSHTYTVTDANGCTKSTTITISQPSAITVMAKVVSPIACKGGATSVTVSATGGTPPYTGTGTYTNQSSGSHTYTVTDTKGCTKSKIISIANGTSTKPSTPGTMSGPTINICGSGPFTYSISAVTGATSYNWAVPAGLNIVSNSGTSISVSNASSAFTTSGLISVIASNTCGTSGARTKTIYAVAQNPTTISGLTSVTANQTGVRYSVTNRSGITFNWSIPTGATITSGQGTNVIRVKFGSSSGNVSVYLSNACGKTSTTSLFVNVGSPLAAVQSFITPDSYLKVYPNPATSIATVAFNAKQGIKYEVVVRDLAGKSIIRESGVANAGETTAQLNMDKYAGGAYLVTLITAEGSKTVKLYKEK